PGFAPTGPGALATLRIGRVRAYVHALPAAHQAVVSSGETGRCPGGAEPAAALGRPRRTTGHGPARAHTQTARRAAGRRTARLNLRAVIRLVRLREVRIDRPPRHDYAAAHRNPQRTAMEPLRKKACPMGSRVEILEHNVSLIRQDLAVVLSNYPTKADLQHEISLLHHEISKLTWKIIAWTTGICTLLTSAVYVMTRAGI